MKKAKRRTKAKAPATGGKLKTWHVVVGLLLAAFVLFEVYGPAIHGPFLFDDNYLPFTDPHYKGDPLITWLAGGRPTLMFTYWLNYKSSGLNPYPYHLVNLLFHFLNGVLVFLIVSKLLEWAGGAGRRFFPANGAAGGAVSNPPDSAPAISSGTRNLIAAFCGALFLLHPLQTEAVAYVASRSENLSVFLFYAAYAVFLYRRKQAISFARSLAVVVLFGLAVTSKEHTAVLPALLLLTDYYWNPGFSFAGIKRNWRLYIPIAVIGAGGFAFVFRTLAESDTAGFHVKGLPWYLYFATQCKAIWIYLRLAVFPAGQNVDYDYPMVTSLLNPAAIAGFLGLVAVVAAAWWYRRRYPLASFGTLVFLLLLAPTSSVVPIKDTLVERRVYLPMIGLLLIVAALLRRWQVPRRVMAGVLTGILVVAAVLCYQRNQVWASPMALWSDTVAKSPDNARAHFQLAYVYYSERHCGEAVREFERVSRLQNPDYGLLVDWGLAYDCAGKPDQALAKLKQAAALENTAHVYSLIGMMYGKQGQREPALAALATAEKLNRRFPMTYVYRGNVYATAGEWEAAAAEYQRALKIVPDLAVARRGLMVAEQRLRRKQ